MSAKVRLARAADAEQVRAIYAPFCAHSAVSFEEEAPGEAEVARRIAAALGRFPWLVCEEAGEVLGYAYAGAHRERAAYRWSVDVTAYVKEGRRGRGIGTALYTSLLALLRLQGLYNAYAGITLPNPASVALHERVGFRPFAVYRAVGYKLGAWHDVGWWHRELQPPGGEPAPPLPLPEAQREGGWESALNAGLAYLGGAQPGE
jgi:phosphinothricin acetyltransferase